MSPVPSLARLPKAPGLASKPVAEFAPTFRQLLGLGIWAGLLGLFLGLVTYPGLDQATETAQAQAGLVNYATNNPFFQYHIRVFSLPIFIAKELLPFLGETQVGMILNGLDGILAMVAMCFFTYAICRNQIYALLVAVSVHLSGIYATELPYHITLFGSADSHGRVGLLTLTLVLAFLLLQYDRTGNFLLGFSPIMHLTLGAYFIGLVCGSLTLALLYARLSRQPLLAPLAGIWRARFWLVAGFLLFLAFFGYHWSQFADAYQPTSASDLLAVKQFLVTIANHHVQFPFAVRNLLPLAFFFFLFSKLWKVGVGRLELFGGLLFFSGLIFLFGSYIPVEWMPLAFWQVVPPRLMNPVYLITPFLLLAMLPAISPRGWTIGLVSCFALLFVAWSKHLGWLAEQPWPNDLGMILLFVLSGISVPADWRLNLGKKPYPSAILVSALGLLLAAGLYGSLTVNKINTACTHRFKLQCWVHHVYPSYHNDAFLREVHDHSKLILVAGTGMVQLKTGVPVWLPDGINQGLYVPSTMTEIANRLKVVYGVDFKTFVGPRDGGIPMGPTLYTWKRRSQREWANLAEDYGFDSLLTSEKLDLPIKAKSATDTLYYFDNSDPQYYKLIIDRPFEKYGIHLGFNPWGDADDFWEAPSYPQEATIRFNEPQSLESVKLETGAVGDRTPTEIDLLGSTDGQNFTLIHQWRVKPFKGHEKRYLPAPNVEYRYFKFRFLGGPEPIMRIYSIEPVVRN